MFIKLLRTHLRPYRSLLWVIVGLNVVQASAGLTLPTLNADLINFGVLPGDNSYIRVAGAKMLGFTFVQICFAAFAVFFGTRTAMAVGRDMRRNLFERVLGYSAQEVGTIGAPSLITRVTNDVQQVQQVIMMGCTMLVQAPITMTVGIIMAMREDVGLSVVLAVAIPIAAVALGTVVYNMIPAFQAMQDRIDQVNRVLREQLSGIRVVRAFVREPQEEVRFEKANAELTATSLRASRLQAAMFPSVTLLINASSVGVLWVGADRIADGTLFVGSLVAYLSYLIQILMAVVMVTFMISMIPRAAVAAGRIQEVLDTHSSVVPPVDPVRQVPEHGTVTFRDVSFAYPGAEHPVLSNVSFTTRPGTTTAIIGSTGAGKTTLLGLVPRLFDATTGDVLVDAVNVRDLDPDILWNVVGFVPQKPYLFSGTIRSNLAYGKPDATDEQMWEALTVAQAADFVQAMPDGLDSHIEQGGTNVSGGQRQRLCIARALVRQPEIYLFDDSFSALDLATDARLRAALKPYTRESAVLIVAQRVSTITDADEIIVLEDGEVMGQGTHDELMQTCPTYLEIVESQIGEQEAAA